MSDDAVLSTALKPEREQSNLSLATSITRAASKQTYYIVRFLVDRDRVPDAYQAYAYFRWVDDYLDQAGMERSGGELTSNAPIKLK